MPVSLLAAGAVTIGLSGAGKARSVSMMTDCGQWGRQSFESKHFIVLGDHLPASLKCLFSNEVDIQARRLAAPGGRVIS